MKNSLALLLKEFCLFVGEPSVCVQTHNALSRADKEAKGLHVPPPMIGMDVY